MHGNIHKEAALSYFEIAQSFDKKRTEEKDSQQKTAYMVVAAQNYFYAGINIIEFVLFKEKREHSFNHENRFRKVKEYTNLFPQDFVVLYDLVDRDIRNKVAYRGENSQKYAMMKQFATMAMKLL